MFIETLRRMGYRPMNENIWAKPVGYGMFVMDIAALSFQFVFRGADGKMCCWKKVGVGENCLVDNFRTHLMFLENDCFRAFGFQINDEHDFSFDVPEEQVSFLIKQLEDS